MFDIVAAARTASPRGDLSEDRTLTFSAASPAGRGVVVCDGVGGEQGSGELAELVAEHVAERLAHQGVGHGIWDLDASLAGLNLPERGATTLLAIGAQPDGLVGHASIGNGSLIEIEASVGWPGSPRLRWTDLALPHVSWDEGRPALRSSVPPADRLEIARGYRWAPQGMARMYVACSDGIATDEDRLQGTAPDGSLWKAIPRPLAALIDALATRWDQLLATSRLDAPELLGDVLEQALDELLDESRLEDDATVGAVLLRPAVGSSEEWDG